MEDFTIDNTDVEDLQQRVDALEYQIEDLNEINDALTDKIAALEHENDELRTGTTLEEVVDEMLNNYYFQYHKDYKTIDEVMEKLEQAMRYNVKWM